jgi:hypothetical protein
MNFAHGTHFAGLSGSVRVNVQVAGCGAMWRVYVVRLLD